MPDVYSEQQLLALDALKALGRPPDKEAVTDLIAALHHLADARGFSFPELVEAAQAKHRNHLAEASGYKVGDEVRLLRWSNESGTVIRQSTDGAGPPLLHVYVPGASHLRTVRAEHVQPAAPFPITTTTAGKAATAGQAELHAITLIATARKDNLPIPPEADQLISALASWSGKGPDQITATLEPKVHLTIASATSTPTRPPKPKPQPPSPSAKPTPLPAAVALKSAERSKPRRS